MKPRNNFITSLLTLAVSCVLHPGAAHAQSVAPVPAPTIINSAPYTISTGGYYQLGANLSYAGNGSTNDAVITINASNVTLDFAGHYISGPTANAATTVYGVYADERSNLLIQNGTIAYCDFGVILQGNGSASTNDLNPRVVNMTVTKCYYVGISIQSAVNPEVTGCRVSSIGGTLNDDRAFGIELASGTGGSAINNTVANITGQSGGFAFGIESINEGILASGNFVSNVTAPSGTGYAFESPGFAVGNTISNSTYGIYNSTKYLNNLTSGCTTPFSGGTAVGSNN